MDVNIDEVMAELDPEPRQTRQAEPRELGVMERVARDELQRRRHERLRERLRAH